MNSLKIKSPFYSIGHVEKEGKEERREGGEKEGRLLEIKWPKFETADHQAPQSLQFVSIQIQQN